MIVTCNETIKYGNYIETIKYGRVFMSSDKKTKIVIRLLSFWLTLS